ncbi:MAG TPA: hypothetical protein VK762_09885 [Polyangiaceae bacterium]|jgi:hypothetical protein|nr:hypothetical protein [Polyangiaceae bacterium]
MRTLPVRIAMASLLFVSSIPGCGLDSQGLLATDAGNVNTTIASAGDASGAVSDDEAGTNGDPALVGDGATPMGDPSMPLDASLTLQADAGAGAIQDATPDAPVTCSSCTALKCPSELAACGAGSACLAYRDCEETCTVKGGSGTSSCSTTCNAMHPGGETAFAALTICDLGCGAGCAAALTLGTP